MVLSKIPSSPVIRYGIRLFHNYYPVNRKSRQCIKNGRRVRPETTAFYVPKRLNFDFNRNEGFVGLD